MKSGLTIICVIVFQGIQQVSIRRLSTGSTFGGDSIVLGLARDSTIVTQEACELLRVESNDFHSIWQVTKLIRPYTSISATRSSAKLIIAGCFCISGELDQDRRRQNRKPSSRG